MTKVLSETEALAVLREGKIGRLGCVDDEGPYVVPINYLLEDDAVYSHSLPGKKIAAMRSSPRVCLQVDQIFDELHWRSAIAFGHFEEIHSQVERRAVIDKLLLRFPKLTPVESMIVEDAYAPDSVVFRIRVGNVTGMEEI